MQGTLNHHQQLYRAAHEKSKEGARMRPMMKPAYGLLSGPFGPNVPFRATTLQTVSTTSVSNKIP